MRRFALLLPLVVAIALMGDLGHRLLMTARGGGPFVAPPPAVVAITTAPHGGWTQPAGPKAYEHNGTLYLGWVNGTDGSVEVAHYAGGALSSIATIGSGLADEGPTDNHNSPAIMVRDSDQRLVTAYAGHLDTRVRVRISTNPEDATAWGSEQVLDPGFGGVYTYPILVQLRGLPNDPIYLFARSIPNLGSQVGRLIYAKSTDGGATWSSWTVSFTGSISPAMVPYWRIGTDWSSRIDVFTTQRSPNDAASQTHHFFIDGSDDSLHTSDGMAIATALPITTADMTVVLDSSSGPNWSWGASWDGTAPATVLMQAISATDNRILTARWRSGAWQVDEVVSSVGGQLGINKYASGAGIHHTDPGDVAYARKVGSVFEQFRATSPDDGATWAHEQLTAGSAVDHVWVDFAEFSDTPVWLTGTYISDTDFDFGIMAAA